KIFEALGKGDVGLGIQQLGLERSELTLDGHLAMAERGHPRPELVERNQLFLIGLDQPRDRSPDANQFLGGDVTLDVHGVTRAEFGQAAIDLGPDQGGIGEELDDAVPDEGVQDVLPNGPVIAAASLWETVRIGARATIVEALATRGPRRA